MTVEFKIKFLVASNTIPQSVVTNPVDVAAGEILPPASVEPVVTAPT
jgi:hypothetical protein